MEAWEVSIPYPNVHIERISERQPALEDKQSNYKGYTAETMERPKPWAKKMQDFHTADHILGSMDIVHMMAIEDGTGVAIGDTVGTSQDTAAAATLSPGY